MNRQWTTKKRSPPRSAITDVSQLRSLGYRCMTVYDHTTPDGCQPLPDSSGVLFILTDLPNSGKCEPSVPALKLWWPSPQSSFLNPLIAVAELPLVASCPGFSMHRARSLLLVYFGHVIAVGTVMIISTVGTVSQYAITTSFVAVTARMRCSSMLRTMYLRCPVCGQAPQTMKP